MSRTFKMVQTPRGMKGTFIHEIVGGEVEGEFLHLPEGTAPETKHDVVTALQKAYQLGQQDRPEKRTPQFDLWVTAIDIAADAPLRQSTETGVTKAQIPWTRIHKLRVVLDQLGIDWRKVKAGS